MTETRTWYRAENIVKKVVTKERLERMLELQAALDDYLEANDSKLVIVHRGHSTQMFEGLLQNSAWSPITMSSSPLDRKFPGLRPHQSAMLRYACYLMGLDPHNLDERIELDNAHFTKSGLLPRFHLYKALIQAAKREHSIALLKGFIDTWYAQQATPQPENSELSPYWEQLEEPSDVTNGVAARLGQGKYVFRVDGCILHDVMQSMGDPEVADLVCCYGDRANFEALNPNFVFTRVHTLMTGPYCDTCMHDRRYVEVIEHPDQAFFRNL